MESHFDKHRPEFDPEEQLTVSLGDPLLDMLAEPQQDAASVTANIREHSQLGKEKALR